MRVGFLLIFVLLAGCSPGAETMVLLDEQVTAVNISKSNGHGDMNQDVMLSFNDKESISIFEKAIKTAVKKKAAVDLSVPDYDVMVEYDTPEGSLPTHGIHLWLGADGEGSAFAYITDETIYLTSSEVTKQLRELVETGG